MTPYDFTIHDLGERGALIQANNAAARAVFALCSNRDAITVQWCNVALFVAMLLYDFTIEYGGTLPRH